MRRPTERQITPLEWALSDDAGISSLTIMHVMEGTYTPDWSDMPRDVGDFGRCCRLLKAFPHYRPRLQEMVDRYPDWRLLVQHWDELTGMYDRDDPDLSFRLQELSNELTEHRRVQAELAVAHAKTVLKPGDRVRITKCPGTKRWFTFVRWEGQWMVSKSGIDDNHPLGVDMVNGTPVNFTTNPFKE